MDANSAEMWMNRATGPGPSQADGYEKIHTDGSLNIATRGLDSKDSYKLYTSDCLSCIIDALPDSTKKRA